MNQHTQHLQQQDYTRGDVPAIIDALCAHPKAQHITYPSEQTLVYEGHLTPGCFLFLNGELFLTSELFQESHQLHVQSVSEQAWTRPSQASNTKDPLSYLLLPEPKQLELWMPYTLTIQKGTQALFISRSLTADPAINSQLNLLSQAQQNPFQR